LLTFLFKIKVTELKSQRRSDNAEIKVILRRIQEIVPTSPQFVHLFNIVFRKCLKLYGMKQIDRNYYDLSQKIKIEQYNLELINGFATSIATYENQLLLNAELTHKILHKRTVYDWMLEIYKNERSQTAFREKCLNELVGRVIMTKYKFTVFVFYLNKFMYLSFLLIFKKRYNDKTYKIDDISWDENPTSTFPRGGRTPGDISYVDYYRTVIF
jgi:aubergine-like protein